MAFDCENVRPYDADEDKKTQITKMFDAISEEYDRMNNIMAWGMETRWRKKTILSLQHIKPKHVLDIATGTGDFAINAYHILKPETVKGVDISEGMMQVGKKKVAQLGLSDKITFAVEDATQLSFSDKSFDAVTIAFGVRNFANIENSFREIYRVLNNGGGFAFVEMTEPSNPIIRPFYKLYTKTIIPIFSRIFSKDKLAYNYLPLSIEKFPTSEKVISLMQDCGFKNVCYKKFLFGVCTRFFGEK
ncbi:MAG: bifunctional demethylmenaquinone methyltransferase/2-methoxy-6-polyprenyl-1,4-benzoquinol methylase UbiE [Paludibacteraceae bacterium]|nr:bifunctional demethylmenaquinone methyltransferase/2-methoxy-6-polyprenyl-1,4-benzoquinol methylase UbiE [Paludibacteraceae bacterium]